MPDNQFGTGIIKGANQSSVPDSVFVEGRARERQASLREAVEKVEMEMKVMRFPSSDNVSVLSNPVVNNR